MAWKGKDRMVRWKEKGYLIYKNIAAFVLFLLLHYTLYQPVLMLLSAVASCLYSFPSVQLSFRRILQSFFKGKKKITFLLYFKAFYVLYIYFPRFPLKTMERERETFSY